MVAGQVKYVLPVKPSQFTVAAGAFYMHGEEGANNLLNRNGERDYLIGVANAQWSMPVKNIPITVGRMCSTILRTMTRGGCRALPASDDDETLVMCSRFRRGS
jgi:hypothetical protein